MSRESTVSGAGEGALRAYLDGLLHEPEAEAQAPRKDLHHDTPPAEGEEPPVPMGSGTLPVADPPGPRAQAVPEEARAADVEWVSVRAGGLQLALPQARCHQIVDEVRGDGLEGSDDPRLAGYLRTKAGSVPVVDTVAVVVPDHHRGKIPAHGNGTVVLVDGGTWGLRCDRVLGALKIEDSQVRWRGERGSRPWLAGTLTDIRCALLELDALRPADSRSKARC